MAKPSNEAAKAMENFFEEVFFHVLTGMLRAEAVEEPFAEFTRKARTLTKHQLHNLARHAAQYYQSRLYPSPSKVSKEKVTTLKIAALENALKELSKEEAE
jgi:hypothetical protein